MRSSDGGALRPNPALNADAPPAGIQPAGGRRLAGSLGLTMAIPRQVRRSDPDTHYPLAWNAMVDLCAMEPLEACSPIQRKAALLFWYRSEVNNGGHFQYFMNRPDYPHREVLALLRELGAFRSASAFNGALGRVESVLPLIVVDSESYVQREDQVDLNSFDTEWGISGNEEVHACLSALLREHESEFVQWLPK